MPKMHINKSIYINASPEDVFSKLNDFNHWSAWSPWLIMDPNATVKVAEDTKYYSWEGERVGSGNMKIISESKNENIDYDLNFLKPWKSHAKVRFEVTPQGEGVDVEWFMDSSLPFFMFWMKKMMVAFVGMDYERGLAMLKDYVEDGKVHSQLSFKGEGNYPGCQYIGISRECSMDDIGEEMKNDFDKLWEQMADNESNVAGNVFSMYHKWDMVKRKVSYTTGIPVKEMPSNLNQGLSKGEIPPTKIYTVSHIGPYQHLGNAWSTMYNMERGKTFKKNKSVHPFETYMNNPAEVPANELITDINFAIK